jgi:hypothetical protein
LINKDEQNARSSQQRVSGLAGAIQFQQRSRFGQLQGGHSLSPPARIHIAYAEHDGHTVINQDCPTRMITKRPSSVTVPRRRSTHELWLPC